MAEQVNWQELDMIPPPNGDDDDNNAKISWLVYSFGLSMSRFQAFATNLKGEIAEIKSQYNNCPVTAFRRGWKVVAAVFGSALIVVTLIWVSLKLKGA